MLIYILLLWTLIFLDTALYENEHRVTVREAIFF
jgi:hypothetical protein